MKIKIIFVFFEFNKNELIRNIKNMQKLTFKYQRILSVFILKYKILNLICKIYFGGCGLKNSFNVEISNL